MFSFKEINSIAQKSKYTDEQLDFVTYSGGDSLIVTSTAGSGKTHSCVGRMHHLLSKGVKSKEIIFFSFTTDAIAELRKRVGDNGIKITNR